MSRLLFIRHAETDMAGRFCGHSDPPINCRGRAQISELIARLEAEVEVVDAIYSSDLRRAMATASALAEKFQTPVSTSSRLREIYFGDWEGLSWAEIEERDTGYARRWSDSFPHLPAPRGESHAEFERRVRGEVEELLHLEERRIAVITHAGVMRVVLRAFLGYSEHQSWSLTKPYCSYFALAGGSAFQEVIR